MPDYIFVPTGNPVVDFVGDFLFECLYTQLEHAYVEIEDAEICFANFFDGTFIDCAECLMEALFC